MIEEEPSEFEYYLNYPRLVGEDTRGPGLILHSNIMPVKTNAEIRDDLASRHTLTGGRHWSNGEAVHGVAWYEMAQTRKEIEYEELNLKVYAVAGDEDAKHEANRFYNDSTYAPMLRFTATVTQLAVEKDTELLFLYSDDDPIDVYTYRAQLTDIEILDRTRARWET